MVVIELARTRNGNDNLLTVSLVSGTVMNGEEYPKETCLKSRGEGSLWGFYVRTGLLGIDAKNQSIIKLVKE